MQSAATPLSPAFDRRRFLALAGAAAFCGLAAAGARPVFPLLIDEGARLGFVLPLITRIAEAGGFEWQPIYAPWPRLMARLLEGEALAWAVSRTPQRDLLLDYSDQVMTRNVWLVLPAGQAEASPGVAGLKGRTLCKRRGYTLDAPLNKAMRERLFDVVDVDLPYAAGLRMMLAGRCDGLLYTHRSSDPAVVERRLERLAPPAGRFVVARPPLDSGGLFFAAARKRPELAAQLERVNAGLRLRAKAIQELLAQET
jgi:ABC-type amino acid transport substrate-binding protein